MATTAVSIAKKFMSSLDNTTKTGTAALDEAVKYCSDGKFTTMQGLINSFTNDLATYGASTYSDAANSTFLKNYCGIILNNSDTGAITGSDAGGSVARTAESIVPESGSVSSLGYPSGSSSTINGLTINWPSKSSLTSTQQAVVARLNKWWTSGALDLIQESYGLNFNESGTTVKTIDLNFYTSSTDGTLAYVTNWQNTGTGKCSKLRLSVNMYYYDNLDLNDTNGKTSVSGAGYLDRTLAHEFVHAVMAANVTYFQQLPDFVAEGLAELVHGIDDERLYAISNLAQKSESSYLKNYVFNLSTEYDCGEDTYAGGYMLFRYLAKQTAGGGTSPSNGTVYGTSGNDTIYGTSSADRYYGLAGNDYIRVSSGSNTVDGGSGKDTLVGGGGNDYMSGGTGNDSMNGGAGNDKMYGGDGKDYMHGGAGSDKMYGGNGDDTITGGEGNDYLDGGANNDYLEVWSGRNTLYGGAGKDTLWGGTGNDSLMGGAGNDSLNGYKGNNTLRGGSGNDILVGGTGIDRFVYCSGDGKDTITGFNSSDDILDLYNVGYTWKKSGSSDVLMTLGSGSILLKGLYKKTIKVNDRYGTTRSVRFSPQGGQLIRGTGRADSLVGGAGNDTIYGYGGNDYISGDAGNDRMDGGANNDWMYGGEGNDTLYGGAGKDTLYGASGNDKLYGGADNDFLEVWSGRNTLDGGSGNDTLWGGTGNDYLLGGTGNDSLNAYSGNNTLRGGTGRDTLVGGTGKDRFVYYKGDGKDIIANFESNKDIIDLRNVNYSWKKSGSSDILMTLGSGSILLKDAYGKQIKINDRYGNDVKIFTNTATADGFLSDDDDASSEQMSAGESRLLAYDGSYVTASQWSLDTTIDSVKASKLNVMDQATSVLSNSDDTMYELKQPMMTASNEKSLV